MQLSSGHFLWLSANRPIAPPGTPFAPDLQSWIRNDPGIAPDWLRVGQDVVGGTARFNGSFLVFGNPTPIPEPDTFAMVVVGLGIVVASRRRSVHRE